MTDFIEAISPVYQVLFWFCEFNVLYYAFLYIVGLLSHKQKYKMVDDKLKFCIFVPCHNEGPVVASTVENYTHINYDKNLYEIYFIADNCSDNTAEILRESIAKVNQSNFHVLERHESDLNKRGKPHALKWGIEQLESQDHFYNFFNMFMILDADNFVDPDILRHMNSQYYSYKESKRPVMIQAYLDSKNNNTLIARGYFETYRVMNAFWQMSKEKLHLVPGIGGTGFAIDMKFLNEIGGFNCTSLTEDLEIEVIATSKNKKIAYNSNVRVYDEKPTKVKASIVQRTRWAQGHWFLFFKYVPRLFISLFNPKKWRTIPKKIDVMIYLSSRLFVLLSAITLVFTSVLQVIAWFNGLWMYNLLPESLGWVYWMNVGLVVLSIAVIPIATLFDGTEQEKKRLWKDLIPNVISIYLIGLLDMIVGFPGLFKCGNQKVWKKTEHKVTTMKVSKEEKAV